MARLQGPPPATRSPRNRVRGLRAASPAAGTHQRWAWLGGLVGALGALAVFAPAAWLASGMAYASNGQVLLAQPRGTVWHGSAQLVLTGGAQSKDATALPERVLWTLWPSLRGLRGELLPVCCSAQPALMLASPRWGGGQLTVTALHLNLPAQLLTGLGTPWNTLNPQGQLAVVADSLSVQWQQGHAQVEGSATIDLTNLSSPLSTLQPLGDYRVSLSGGATPTLELQTLQGALQLSGSGKWVGSRMQFTGEASAAPEREAALNNLLNIIGRRQGAKSLMSIG
ncbi:MAG: type II secretion system protein N [Burkholderiaceae bacterium]